MTRKACRKPPTVARVYPPGFFTEPARAWACLEWNGPLTVPASKTPATDYLAMAAKGRRKAAADGSGWGSNSMVLPGTPTHLAPGWQRKGRG